MSSKTKTWLVTAVFLVVIGCIIFGGVMMALNWDFLKLSTVRYETSEYAVKDDYKNIAIVTDTADIVFEISESAETSVVCYEAKNAKHTVKVNDGRLEVKLNDTRKWYEYIGIGFANQKITVSIPKGVYGELIIKSDTGEIEIPKDLRFESIGITGSTGDVTSLASAAGDIKIKTSTGDILVENTSAASFDLSVSTGRVTAYDLACEKDITIRVSTGKTDLKNIRCKSIISKGSTGAVSLENVIAKDKISIERSTGDVRFDSSDAGEIFIKTSTGNVRGSLLSDKIFFASTDTGRVDVPKTMTGGKCEITTDTGDIKITVEN